MPDLEFTGERVIPGLVEANLYNEHIARYRLAARLIAKFAPGGRVLDAGCGSGYGSAEFERAGHVVAVDTAAEAVDYARQHYGTPRVSYAQARCEALPFAEGSFDAVVAFEVIEHLENWAGLLTESSRVLRPGGLLLVSTPNRAFYAETRSQVGPNPFHAHEFDYAEFESALRDVFAHITIWRENHGEGILLTPPAAQSGELELGSQNNPGQAHFFLGICSSQPLPEFAGAGAPAFAWMPEAGNILQTRARHITLLQSEVDQKTAWLANLQVEHAQLVKEHKAVVQELERSNNWATELNARIARSKQEIERRDLDLEARREWIERLQKELSERDASIVAWQQRNETLEAEAAETTQRWMAEAARLEDELRTVSAAYEAKLDGVQVEAAQTAAAWSAECGRLRAELQANVQAYEAQVLGLQAELAEVRRHYDAVLETQQQELTTAYEQEFHRLTMELTSVHAGYQQAIRTLEAELSSCHDVYGQIVASHQQQAAETERALGEARAQLRAVAESKWNRLGRVAGFGPRVDTD